MTEHHPVRRSNPLNANLVSSILIVNFIVIGGLIFGNMPLSSPQGNAAELDEVALAAASTTLPAPTFTSTPLPPTASQEPDPTLTATPLSEQPAADEAFDGDAANGEVLFNTFQAEAGFACATCHRPDSEARLIGPGLLNVGTRAETRIEDLSAVEYIRTSIVNPGAYVVESFPDALMPQNWAEIYVEDEINDLIAYLLTLE